MWMITIIFQDFINDLCIHDHGSWASKQAKYDEVSNKQIS